jgi:hypothetical protein
VAGGDAGPPGREHRGLFVLILWRDAPKPILFDDFRDFHDSAATYQVMRGMSISRGITVEVDRLAVPTALRPFAAALSILLAGLFLAASANAASFTMQELYDNTDGFTIGSTKFSNFTPSSDGAGTANPNLVIVETVENSDLVGFTVKGPGFFDDSSFNYNFQVVQLDSREINGASLWITDLDFEPTLTGAITISAFECEFGTPGAGGPGDCVAETQNPRPELTVERNTDPTIDLIDGQVFDPTQGSGNNFKMRNELTTEITGGGTVRVSSYATLFSVVPEPSTALLLGGGLIGLAVRRRSVH